MDEQLTAAVLRNRGTPVRLLVLDEKGAAIRGEDGSPEYEKFWLRYTANEIADMEDHFLGLGYMTQPYTDEHGVEVPARPMTVDEAYNHDLVLKPRITIRYMVALGLAQVLRPDELLNPDEFRAFERLIAKRMDPEMFNEHTTSVGCSYFLAMGIDPFGVVKMWEAGLTVRGREIDLRAEAIVKTVEAVNESLGGDGSRSGRRSDADIPTSSGGSPPGN